MQRLALLLLLGVTIGQRVDYTCSAGTYWTGQACLPCLNSYCTCSSLGGCDKITCPSGTSQSSDGKSCINCPNGCRTCSLTGSNGFTCGTCSSSYSLLGINHYYMQPAPASKPTQQPTHWTEPLDGRCFLQYLWIPLWNWVKPLVGHWVHRMDSVLHASPTNSSMSLEAAKPALQDVVNVAQEELALNAMPACSGKWPPTTLSLLMDGELEVVNHALDLEYLHAQLLKHPLVAK